MPRHDVRDPRERILERCYPYQLVDRPDLEKPCLVWTGAMRKQYGAIRVQGIKSSCHRVMLEAVLGRRLRRNEVVLHACDNPPCCEPTHLRAGLQRTNVRDMVCKGRHEGARHGAANHCSKYTEARIRVLLALYHVGFNAGQLSALCGMPISTIRGILSGKRWKCVIS